ncbi:acetyltransferase [Trichodelitschia bisporula]|uniref:Acetyltransferase n=1 Tax=Trichodelitschia bisporula TaxID=703511 RepID=A0A6G1I1V4_9PEZI|nr:acetyltransferase [Trichodelitschia bisporula]
MSPKPSFPFPIRTIANDKVKLLPFTADRHADAYFTQTVSHPELYVHMPTGPFVRKEEFIEQLLEKTTLQDPGWFTYAVIDKTRQASAEDDEGELAGMISFLNTSAAHMSTEIGCIVILPPFHRTHVTTNAAGLMLQFALNSPIDGGLDLRRVVWQVSSMNAASIRVAERLGFHQEGLLRWHFVFPNAIQMGKVGNGRALPPGCSEHDLGRDTVVFSMYWGRLATRNACKGRRGYDTEKVRVW